MPVALAVLAGCASYGPGGLQAGDPEAEVIRQMGPPTGRHAMPDGERRLEYARGPMGLHTWMIDLDDAGRVRRWTQVLDAAHFARIVPGLDREMLRRELGRPAEVRRYAMQNEEVWSYRHEHPLCAWFQVSLDIGGPVRSAGYAPDPRCEPFEHTLP